MLPGSRRSRSLLTLSKYIPASVGWILGLRFHDYPVGGGVKIDPEAIQHIDRSLVTLKKQWRRRKSSVSVMYSMYLILCQRWLSIWCFWGWIGAWYLCKNLLSRSTESKVKCSTRVGVPLNRNAREGRVDSPKRMQSFAPSWSGHQAARTDVYERSRRPGSKITGAMG